MIRFEVKFRVDDKRVKNKIWKLLCDCDDEFIPRLSFRESSVQNDLKVSKMVDIYPQSYFDEIIKQSFILAFDNDEFLGFIYSHQKSGKSLG